MAEALFNHLAEGRAQAYSAGTQPGDRVNPVAVEAMKEIGIDISASKPKTLTVEMIEEADRMITMGCGDDAGALCPASFIETEDWALEDPHGKSIEQVRRIREEIRERVTDLLEHMASERGDQEAEKE
jgi:protein-tyrosine-phosphatase